MYSIMDSALNALNSIIDGETRNDVEISLTDAGKIEQISFTKNNHQIRIDLQYETFIHVYLDKIPKQARFSFEADLRLRTDLFPIFDLMWWKYRSLRGKAEIIVHKNILEKISKKVDKDTKIFNEAYGSVFSDEIDKTLLGTGDE